MCMHVCTRAGYLAYLSSKCLEEVVPELVLLRIAAWQCARMHIAVLRLANLHSRYYLFVHSGASI